MEETGRSAESCKLRFFRVWAGSIATVLENHKEIDVDISLDDKVGMHA